MDEWGNGYTVHYRLAACFPVEFTKATFVPIIRRLVSAMTDQYDDTRYSWSDENHLMDIDDSNPDIIKVSAKSRSTAVAGAIAGVIREHNKAEVQAIGAGAVNQAVKALAIARGYLERDQIDIVFVPFFTEVEIDGQERTAVRFQVFPRKV